MGVVIEEADETVFWIELLCESGVVKECVVCDLLKESNELLAIFAASKRTALRAGVGRQKTEAALTR